MEKNGKADKDRGEVLLDIQFTRNSMTASMFDLSMQDKPRSRLSKIKDKVRGKKKDVDSASAVVPASVNQVLTDSEGEEEDVPSTLRNKKSSKFKSLFGSKTNLNKGISQSMSTLGTLPEKNSSLSGSQISGLNEESADGKCFGLKHISTCVSSIIKLLSWKQCVKFPFSLPSLQAL